MSFILLGQSQMNYRPIEPDIVSPILKDVTTLIVSIDEAVNWNNQTPTIATYQAALYTDLINVARTITEKYCWLDLTQCRYQAYFDLTRFGIMNLFGSNIRLVLPRAPILNINNIEKIEYLDGATNTWIQFTDGAQYPVDGLYLNDNRRLEQRQWASVYFTNPPAWAATINAWKIRVTFTCGYDYPYTGAVSLSYNSTTGVVTATTALPNYLTNNSMYVTITGAVHTGYNVTKPITVLSPTQFTYQLATGLTLPNESAVYTAIPNGGFVLPAPLKLALKNIISYNYAVRGDSQGLENIDGYPVPAGTRAILDQYSITKSIIGGDYI